MIVLSIDSSSKVATVAILKDDVLLGEYILNDKREHSVILMPLIENLLKECKMILMVMLFLKGQVPLQVLE